MMVRFNCYVLLLAAAMIISACIPTTGGQAQDSIQPTAGAVETTSAYPVTLDHKFGSTTITQRPERIVLVGLTEQDALLALGVVPVATREWYGGRPGAIFPWAQSSLGTAVPPVVLGAGELNFEQIASLNPDIIIGLYAGLTQEEYDLLAKIAPTVAQPAEYVDWGIPWQETTRRIGLIMGESARAEQLIAGVDALFAEARSQYPQFDGASAVIASTWGYPENYYVYGPQDARGRFLTSLGFQIPGEIGELVGTGFGTSISRERLDLVDTDVLVWIANTPAEAQDYRSQDVYQQLRAAKEGRDIFLTAEDPLYDALNFSSVLSLPYAIEGLTPLFADAVDGSPAQ